MQIEQARRPHVKFETKAEYYVDAEGVSHYKNVHYANVTPAGSNGKQMNYVNAEEWLAHLKAQSMNQGMDCEIYQSWHSHFTEMFNLYKQGEEMKTDGMPIRAVLAFSPAQVAMAESMKIFSLEDLAQINETEMAAMGLGARDMKIKAVNILESSKNNRAAEENAALRQKLDEQNTMVEQLKKDMQEMRLEFETRPPKGKAA